MGYYEDRIAHHRDYGRGYYERACVARETGDLDYYRFCAEASHYHYKMALLNLYAMMKCDAK